MDVQRAEIPAEFLLLLDANVLKVLVPKDDHAALGDEERQLVLLHVVQLRQLQPPDLGADDGRQLAHPEVRVVLGEQIRLLLVGRQRAVGELERLEGREARLLVVDGKIGRVLVLCAVSGKSRHWLAFGDTDLLMNLVVVGEPQLERLGLALGCRGAGRCRGHGG